MNLKFFLFFVACQNLIYGDVVVHFGGRLGNQLFQAAAAIALAEENQCGIYFPDFEQLNCSTEDHGLNQLKQNYKYIFSRIPRIQPKVVSDYLYIEPDFSYHPVPYKAHTEIKGLFCS